MERSGGKRSRMSALRLLQRDIPAPTVNEARLLYRARTACPELDYADLTADVLARIARERGVDFATALLYDRVRRSPEHGPFVAAIEAHEPDLDALPRLAGTVLVVPAPFYRELPEFGGDGRLVREVAADLGLAAKLVPVRSTGSVRGNAAIVGRALAAETDGPVVLVSLSKGGADARIALEAGSPPNLRAWIQMCGMIRGSPLVDARLDGPWWRRRLARGFLAITGVSVASLAELRHGPGSLLARPAVVPPGLTVINVVGCPLAAHLAGRARARHRQLASLGPNDGSTLIRDAIVEPGLVYPVWGADHYFRVPQASHLLYRLFISLARSGHLTTVEEATPRARASIA